MIRLIAFAAFALAITTPAQAMPLAPVMAIKSLIECAKIMTGANRTGQALFPGKEERGLL